MRHPKTSIAKAAWVKSVQRELQVMGSDIEVIANVTTPGEASISSLAGLTGEVKRWSRSSTSSMRRSIPWVQLVGHGRGGCFRYAYDCRCPKFDIVVTVLLWTPYLGDMHEFRTKEREKNTLTHVETCSGV
ncbi:hypothetical protein CAPTEDRAFT_198398 [Capitella teleta]|uniref:Uncharacterized protein n=1 Tax=Capitella teleta TaxID=283909 RepID=R7UJY8_CAPTE|nr:hypothetical protein CAPTEDRAFT_198398 [Capitella teleta]|eukprot:ELU06413.1 hypothetical protein CAPTEDRAFT_198398 [Capitella teleta]